MSQPFVEGDRVGLVEAHPDGTSHQLGTVMQTYPMPGVYPVQFDGEAAPRIVAGPLLAHLPGDTKTVQPTMTFQSK